MSLFQKSVEQKYLKQLDSNLVEIKYNQFKTYFGNPEIQDNIRSSKEEQFQEGFLRELFVNILGYTLNPAANFNLTTEYKNIKDSKKADGAIIINEVVKAVIELKGTDTTDLGKVESQAFGYKNNQPDCIYIVTSNFEKLRFYIDNAIEYIEFNLFTLNKSDFQILYLCLACVLIEKEIPKKIKEESISQEDVITKDLYQDYSLFKRELHQNLVMENPQFDSLVLFKKSQKLLDRFLFLFFAEDRQLLPPNSVRIVLNDWKDLKDRDVDIPLYDRFKKYFGYLNTGFKGKRYDVFAYNGGLFKPDEILDAVKIDDSLLFRHTFNLSDYDFASEVDVNILGHIFENSLNELDEIKAQLEGEELEKSKTKRKRDGIYYTPKYITKYIVENTIGRRCTEKKTELQILEEEYSSDKKRQIKTKQSLFLKLKNYRNWLLQLTICDPACGSGAFLNQALDYLIKEHRYIDELQAKLFNDSLILSDIENSILENNLFGVDLNEESVEIAKLSLWLRTAQPNRKLNDLNNNIKCGNSLIGDPNVAGDKAFNWEEEFPNVFSKGGFDIVIGNPPYTYRNAISGNEKSYFKLKYSSYEGNFDLYKFFIEKLVDITSDNGYSSFIVPNTFLSALTYQKLREVIIAEFDIIEFFDLGLDVFQNVVVESIIFTFKKSIIKSKNTVIKIDREREGNYFSVENSYEIDLTKYYLKDKTFNIYLSSEYDKVISKCQHDSLALGDLAYCTVGINTGYIKDALTSKTQIDSRYHKMLNGKNIGRNFVEWEGDWIMYDIDFVKAQGDRGRSLPPEYIFTNEKILVQRTRRGMKRKLVCFYDNEKFYNLNRISNIVLTSNKFSLKYIYLLLNSELLDFYFNKYFNEYEVKPAHLAKLPIKNITLETQQSFIEYADLILSLNSELQEVALKFQRTIQRKFNLEELSNKLQVWYTITYKELLLELGKKKLKLSLSQEAEWENYFLQESEKALELKAKIDTLDKVIDQMVYKLYDLSEEEIKIVEGTYIQI